jgi:hypothetical protein
MPKYEEQKKLSQAIVKEECKLEDLFGNTSHNV